MSTKIPVSTKIFLARSARHLSLRQLEERTGINFTTIHYFETGKQSPTIEQYERIQAALGYDLESDAARAAFLFFLNGKPAPF